MEALRNIYTVKNNRITIDFPEYFKYSSVEVIILPVSKFTYKQINNENSKNKQLEQLLSVGVWYDNDIEPILESQKLINQWKITEF